jgi:excisionase family DNA binding protein
MTDAPEYLRAGEIARLSGVSVRTVRRWIAEGTLPSVKVRGVRLVSRKGFERVLLPAPPDWAAPEGEIEQEKAFRNIGKAHGENTSIFCMVGYPNVTVWHSMSLCDQGTRWRGHHERE